MMKRYRFIGPQNRHVETSISLLINGEAVGIGQEFDADQAFIDGLSERFVFEEVSAAVERKDVTISAPHAAVTSATHTPMEGR
jgi:hypothetical protein